MSVFLISYDLNKQGQNYTDLIKAIKSYNSYCQCLNSQWLIATNDSSNTVYNHLAPKIDNNDRLFIVQVVQPLQGWLSQDVIDWIEHYSALGHIPRI
ncbi:hypothetical protein [Veillonella sp. R32]|uniref:hypothetical protein n=1 Tax=Veillonella sp. R32 TaxID=2021312 RepID=UPI00138A58FF|nr:hypothetical protein [Veillonella sp. R32]KAF1680469.1 hypothetical protein VER_08515 [Veillonella sp. R32]